MRWLLVAYDLLILLAVYVMVVFLWGGRGLETIGQHAMVLGLASGCLFFSRYAWSVYKVILRYGGVGCYLRLVLADFTAFLAFLVLEYVLPVPYIDIRRVLVVSALCTLTSLVMRLSYRYCFRNGTKLTNRGQLMRLLLRVFAGEKVILEKEEAVSKIRIAILGAGRLGTALADELLNNDSATYKPECFIDMDKAKIGRRIKDLPVVAEGGPGLAELKDRGIQEIVFAITELTSEKRDFLYKIYRQAGYKIKTYDYPMQDATKSGKRGLREFDIEELLFRNPIEVDTNLIKGYYQGKTILITGGGGSIGSELCRQLAKLEPKLIVILDIYENGVYDVQQELKFAYKDKLDLRVEIVSICNKTGLARVFEEYNPDIVIHAAAHKHVPLMEKNCLEAVENNVFGTKNVIDLCEEYGVKRFMMVSTDKAVNPTNIMGATKRMCELMTGAYAAQPNRKTTYSETRFGNVLGSAGSVIPLFKRQIASGGPITLTDKRIIRYFMTIPEASQLVLQSGAMAKNGELFVLDMGQPVKILDLAENMIRLSGLEPYKDIDIIETGLRPGEKLYEELLVQSDTLKQTANKLIFIEKDEPITMEDLQQRLRMLDSALTLNTDIGMRIAMHKAVPTFKTPEEVNKNAETAAEMQNVREI